MGNIGRLKMLPVFLFVFLIVNESISATTENRKLESCNCYDACSKNYETNSFRDVQKIAACQRGCRFYSLIVHTTNERNNVRNSADVKAACQYSCAESYKVDFEMLACNFGCLAMESTRNLCNSMENQNPQIGYSVLIEESDILIHSGEPDPDDVITDPGLRKQFERTLEALVGGKSKLPEIHFRNLPIENGVKSSSRTSRINFKCPKFYGFDSKFEFRNGKIIIGDLYLFAGVFVFVAICFLLGHRIEAGSVSKKKSAESKLSKKKKKKNNKMEGEDLEDGEPLLKSDLIEAVENEPPADFVHFGIETEPETKFEGIRLASEETNAEENNPKI